MILRETDKCPEISVWALNIYSIIRTIKDTMSFHVRKDIMKSDFNNVIRLSQENKKEIEKKANLLTQDISFASIYSYNEQFKIINYSQKYRNFSFETLLTHYLINTKPGREYSYYLLNEVQNYHENGLLNDIHSITLVITGKENKTGNYFSKLYGNARVVGGIQNFTWKEHPNNGPLRANSLDVAFIVRYKNKDIAVVLGEVEGNKGKTLLDKNYWDKKKPKCALFGIGCHKIQERAFAIKKMVTCTTKPPVPVVIFPDSKSSIFENDEILKLSGFEELIGYTFHTSFTEFIRFMQTVQPKQKYECGNIKLSFIFTEICTKLWDTPFELLLDYIENKFILDVDKQQSLIAYNWRTTKHYLTLSSNGNSFSHESENEWKDPFIEVFPNLQNTPKEYNLTSQST